MISHKNSVRVAVAGGAVALSLGFASSASAHGLDARCDGSVARLSGSLYQEADYQIDAGPVVHFVGGFSVARPGNVAHTLTVSNSSDGIGNGSASTAVCAHEDTTTPTTAPDTTVPETTVPDTTLPETTEPAVPPVTVQICEIYPDVCHPTTTPELPTTIAPPDSVATWSTRPFPVVMGSTPASVETPAATAGPADTPSTSVQSLPSTGRNENIQLGLAGAVVVAGAGLVALARRRRPVR